MYTPYLELEQGTQGLHKSRIISQGMDIIIGTTSNISPRANNVPKLYHTLGLSTIPRVYKQRKRIFDYYSVQYRSGNTSIVHVVLAGLSERSIFMHHSTSLYYYTTNVDATGMS